MMREMAHRPIAEIVGWEEEHVSKIIRRTQGCRRRRRKDSVRDDATLPLLRMMRTAIQKRFDEASDNPDHFQKVAWFVQYWNSNLDCGIEGLERIISQPL
jgi:hypothetical protein